MNIVVTGSLGNISKPLTKKLVQKNHLVTVISSSPERKEAIEALDAVAAIGNLEDADFLTATFASADAVYCMIPMNFNEPDQEAWLRKIADSYAVAIQKTGVKRVILLSGWAAGIIDTYKELEDVFNNLSNISITHIRPGYFYSNFYDSTDMIKGKGFMGMMMTLRYMGIWALLTGKRGLLAANFGDDDKLVLTAPADIADAVANEIIIPQPTDKKIRYVASDEMTCNEAARILGAAIGKPYLKWVTLSDKEMQRGLEMFGLSPKLASSIVEMQAPIHKGLMAQEFSRHQSETATGKVKMEDFAKEFAAAYHNN